MLEKNFQSNLIKEIKKEFPDSMVLKNDPTYIQGIPDILILHKNKWAALEIKKDNNSSHRPNQDYYVKKMNEMSYANFISPDNEKEVINELHKTFES